MKKVLLLIVSLNISSCALSAKPSVPVLSNRTLEVSKDRPGFEYPHCVKKKFLSKRCKKWKVDFYDFTDDAQRNRLRDMGFVLVVEEK